VHVAGSKPQATIPARFETILFSGPRERKGFSSEARRFNDPENDLPGPGSYDARPAPLTAVKAESTGKKGYGPLVSSARRFSDRHFYTGPGPGEHGAATGALQDHSFSRAPVGPAFAVRRYRCAAMA
jgi:hypothetical protein